MRYFFPWLLTLLLVAVVEPLSALGQTISRSPASVPVHSGASATGTRNADDFPGTSIVEKIQAAIRDCGSSPCAVYIPAGSYDSSPIASWRNKDTTGSRAGVLLPSNVEIRGAGEGITTIRVARAATDPPATLFANANANPNANPSRTRTFPSRNISLRHMSIIWTDSSA
ncbi:MAG: hypothetical protein WA172_11220, partial [Terriglobales bacterium]